MSLKKILTVIAIVFLAVITGIFLLNTFVPQLNFVTQPVITFLTVDLIHYVQNGITYITTAIALIGATIGAAMRKIGQAKTEVQNVKTIAAEQSSDANNTISGILNEKDSLVKTVASKDEQIATLNTQFTQVTETQRAAETLKIQQAQTLVNYEKEIKDLRVMLANRPVEVVTVTK